MRLARTVSAEFVLTGLSRADGNRANHEIGICLPQLQVNVSTNCMLTVKPKYSTSSYISLLVTGRDAEGRHNVPLASDSAAAIAEAVNKDVGYYYLEPHRCPQSYSMKIKGSKLLAAGEGPGGCLCGGWWEGSAAEARGGGGSAQEAAAGAGE